MSGKLVLFLLQLTTKKSFWATLATILLTIIGFIGFLIFVVFGTALAGTYTAEDDVILAVDAQYSNMEKSLSSSLQNGPALYPGYDEYVYNLAEVGHDGNILASYLSALHPRYTQDIVQSDLDALLDEQYTVSTHETIEIRERIVGYEEDPDDPDELIPIVEEYEYRILTISLSNNRLSFVKQLLNTEQQKMYDLYKMLSGNKPYLFPTYSPDLGDTVLPEEIMALLPPDVSEGRRAIIAAAISGVGHITYDVSQSRQPSGPGLAGAGGSLDCSRFIKWAYWTARFTDWDADSTSTYSRANCVRQISRSELQPGDIAMLEPSGSGNNHVRIYIGNGYWVESCYGHGACINNWTDEQNGGHAYRQFWRYVGFD